MTVFITPYLSFAGTTRDAMGFYQSVFGGELHVLTPADAGIGEDTEAVAHAYLSVSDTFQIMAGDLAPTASHQGISLNGSADDADLLHNYWDQLAEDAFAVHMELGPAPWGGVFGAVTDRFDITWNVTIGI